MDAGHIVSALPLLDRSFYVENPQWFLRVDLSPEELADLPQQVASSGLTLNDFVRRAIADEARIVETLGAGGRVVHRRRGRRSWEWY